MPSNLTKLETAAKIAALMIVGETAPWVSKTAPVMEKNETSLLFFALAKGMAEVGMFEKNPPQMYFTAMWGTWLGFAGQTHPHASERDIEFGQMIRTALDVLRRGEP